MEWAPRLRDRIRIRGAVQGVGFRPFVYRLARELELSGWVENSNEGVTLEIEGAAASLESFQTRLPGEAPQRAYIQSIETRPLPADGSRGFAIRASAAPGAASALVLPDGATCGACRHELFDAGDRRWRYPFINCTDCGPRYSIVLGLPYDRARTTMARFTMCAACRAEYGDPEDRRFHAEPNACPSCGPSLELWDARGRRELRGDEALLAAAGAIRSGRIVAVKGLGGFHLMADAHDDDAVRELRRRKRREAKPFAVMVATLEQARRCATISDLEARLLRGPEAPIVLVERRVCALSPRIAPGNPDLGLLLAYTPLHHLLMEAVGRPIVATSANVTDEPICIDADEALARLAGIADLFLVHDREIARYVDDSVVRVMCGRPMVVRRARGFAPLPVAAVAAEQALLAVGAHAKNSVALSNVGQVIASPHVGDLDTALALNGFQDAIATLEGLQAREAVAIACDLHPDYASTQWARRQRRPLLAVQHHHAHVLAGMADNALTGAVTGVAWDGSGYGPDGTIWGGEVLRVDERGFERCAWLRPFPLPGGEAAVREPRRSALGVLWAVHGPAAFELDDAALRTFSAQERTVLRRMLERGLRSPLTSSAGRLFDAVAALAGLHPIARYEGEAAMALEFALRGTRERGRYPIETRPGPRGLVLDWEPLIDEVRADVRRSVATGLVAGRFHNALVEGIVAAARHVGETRVLLTGGCFQNRYLTEVAIHRLREEGFQPFWHRAIPPNDGGIAVGQLVALARNDVLATAGALLETQASCV